MTTTTIQRPALELSSSACQTARVLGHPALLFGTALSVAAAIEAGVPFGLAALGILLLALAYLFGMERAIPYREAWQPRRSEWKRDGLYFGLNGAVSTAIPALVGLLAIHLARGTTGLALGAELPLAFLAATFVGYWTHRLGHDLGALWQIHGVHHAPDKVNA